MEKRTSRADRIAVACINTAIILIGALLFCGFIYAARPRHFSRDNLALTYTIQFSAVRAEYTGDIHAGDRVLDAVGKREIGEVVGFAISPAMTETYSRNENRLKMVEYPGRVDLLLTVRCTARQTADGYSIGGFSLAGGKKIPLRLPNFVGTGICTMLDPAPT